VHIQACIRTDSITVGGASGFVLIGGLPFPVVASSGSTDNGQSPLAIGFASTFAGDVPIAASARAGSSNIDLYFRTSANGSATQLLVSDMGTGANENHMYVAGTYITG
jgi:hypothetical protein